MKDIIDIVCEMYLTRDQRFQQDELLRELMKDASPEEAEELSKYLSTRKWKGLR